MHLQPERSASGNIYGCAHVLERRRGESTPGLPELSLRLYYHDDEYNDYQFDDIHDDQWPAGLRRYGRTGM